MAEILTEALPEALRLHPTLVVGVGGIGCWIADRVYAMASETGATDSSRIVILGFDTDDNDIQGLDHLKREQIIRTSTADTVFTVLSRSGDVIESWFVDDDQLTADFRQMTLINGAGAIRMLSRLAFDEAMQDPGIHQKLVSAVGSIATQNNRDIFEGHVNVLMVGSLAGGTGSGMFLQAALFLADTLRWLGIAPSVRGLFLLPDIVVNAGRIAKDQILGVRANAYAALKELNAISRYAQGLGPTRWRARPVDFAYVRGRALQTDGRPFESVVLMDYEQQRGGHLGHNFDSYRELAARAAYTLLFTPIGGGFAQRAVNDIRTLHAAAAAGADNRFAGVGVSAIVYPQARILDYLCLQLGLSILQGDWLRLDREYRLELSRYQARVNNGEGNLERPALGPFYAQKLEQLANAEQIRFYQGIYRDVYRRKTDERGRESEEVTFRIYLDALERHLVAAFWSSEQGLRDAKAREALGADALTDRDALAGDVSVFERHLRTDFDRVERGLATSVDNLFYTSVLGAAVLGEPEWKDYHLESYVLRGGPHLVEVRYFLYKLRAEMQTRAKDLKGELKRKAIEATLKNAFDDPQTTTVVETANDIAAKLAASRVPDVLDRRLPRFVRGYREHYNNVSAMIRDLGEEGTRARLYELLDRYLGRLLDVLERFFADLDRLELDLTVERNQLEQEHSAESGLATANRYVFADPQAKQSLWEELRARIYSASVGDQNVNAAITGLLIERFRAEARPNSEQVLPPFSGSELFRRDIIQGFARDLITRNHGDLYRMSATTAVRREANLSGRDPDDHLTGLVDLVAAQSAPFLSLSSPGAGQPYRFWALSPSNRESIGSAERANALFSRNHGEGPLVEPEFPDHTLLCLSSIVNLCLTDFSKLDPGLDAHINVAAPKQGIYEQAYRKMVDEALWHERTNPDRPNPVFTPHLDRSWHRPGVLPEIHPRLEAEQERRLMDAYVCGLALGLLPRGSRDGRPVTLFRDWSLMGTLQYERVAVEGEDDSALIEAMGRDPTMAVSILERRSALESMPMPPDGDGLYQGLTNPDTLVRAAALLADQTRAELNGPLAEAALVSLFTNLRQCNDRLHRTLGASARGQKLAETGKELIAEAARRLASVLDSDTLGQVRQMAEGQLDLAVKP